MLLIGCWFKFAAETYAITIAMILAIIGQIVAWGIVYYIKTESLVISEAYGAIIFVLILWSISIVLVFHNMKGKNKLERKFYSSEGRTQLERKSFSKYVKDEILERQQNRCAMCNNNLFYSLYDHIDGNRSNNSLGNCQALCPNCHDLKTRRDQRNK